MTTATQIVENYHHAWTSGDVDSALQYVSEAARCSAPDPDIRTKTDWRGYLQAFVPMLTGTPELARMSDDNRVALWYYPQTSTTKTTLASELFVVEDGAIVEIHLSFDRLGYAPNGDEG
jgi:hypothetical protein